MPNTALSSQNYRVKKTIPLLFKGGKIGADRPPISFCIYWLIGSKYDGLSRKLANSELFHTALVAVTVAIFVVCMAF